MLYILNVFSYTRLYKIHTHSSLIMWYLENRVFTQKTETLINVFDDIDIKHKIGVKRRFD